MDLPAYITHVGDAEAARLFDVTLRAVASWRYGARRPRPRKALEIERVTKGKVRFAEIYREDHVE